MARFVIQEEKVEREGYFDEIEEYIYDKENDTICPLKDAYSIASLLNYLAEHEHKILVVEDGSVDTNKLEKDGFYVILYRQGSQPPMILGKGEK